jgi:hypothetical protein
MNALIKELAEQSGVREDLVDNLKDEVEVLTYIARPQDIQKFAELIVRECIDKIENEASQHDESIWAVELINDIKDHFEIE